MNRIDLHVHSTFSDGTYTPTMLVEEANRIGLSAMALTDHDTVNGIPEAMQAAAHTKLELIPGVEISTSYKDKEVHIVGLFLDYQNEEFLSRMGSELERRAERNARMIEAFHKEGFPISMAELEDMFPNAVITRAHFASWLRKKGYVESNQEAFVKYLGDGCPLYVPRERKSIPEALGAIKAAHGIAILAHPLLYHFTSHELEQLCVTAKEHGLVGIETMYSTYKGFDELEVRKLAHKVGLEESGGSDFHGANKPHIQLGTGMGNLAISASYLENLRKHL